MAENINNNKNESNKDRPRIKPPAIRPRPPRSENARPMSSQMDSRRSSASSSVPLPPRTTPSPFRRDDRRIQKEPGTIDHAKTVERHMGTPKPHEGGSHESAPGRGGRGRRSPRLGHSGEKRPGELPGTSARKFGGHAANPMAQEINTTASSHANPEALRLVPLGGLEEIGRNCSFIEYKNEIVIIDAGLQFPEEETPGIDYIIPNTTYLEGKKQNVRAIILTHGHYDHIGALPYMVERLGNPTIYATSITKAIVERRQEDFPNSPKLKVVTVKHGDELKLSNNISAYFFGVPHTIPETTGVLLKTPIGNVCHFADFRVDYNEAGEPQGLDEFEKVGKMGVHTFMVDSTNADKLGKSPSEKTVEKNLEEIFKQAEGRILVATFASLITRIAEIIKIAERLGRKVALNGYSMKTNMQIAETLGFVKAKEGTIISVEEAVKLKDDKVLIMTTGAQGESNAGLMKIINGEHRHIRIKPGDTMVLSSSVIPGNERSVQTVQDNLARQGAIIFHSGLIDIHSSGHAPKEDLKLVMRLIKPKFLMPVHGYYFKRSANVSSAREVGIPKENVIMMDNGQVAELTKDTFTITKETVPAFYVMVDGLGVGDVEEVVLRDRRALAQEGMIVIIMALGRGKGARLLKNPDIISRGFIYLKENQELMDEMRKRIRGLMTRLPGQQEMEPDYLKTLVRDQIGQFLYTKTRRRPMILPVVIEI